MNYDLLLKGGELLDGSRSGQERGDLAFLDGKVASVGGDISPAHARETLDVTGKLVTPGLIDLHTHVYWWAKRVAVNQDDVGPITGVTTAVDGGSAGSATIAGLQAYAQQARARIYAFLHISAIGLAYSHNVPELVSLDFASVKGAVRVAQLYPDLIVGIKIRLGQRAVAPRDEWKALGLAMEAARAAGIPLMVHIGGSATPLADVLNVLQPRDIVTHCFTGNANGILDAHMQVIPEALAAAERGVAFDVGFGHTFSHAVAAAAIQQRFLPTIVSTDMINLEPIPDMPSILSLLLAHGLSLEEVFSRVTQRPAAFISPRSDLGRLAVGVVGDAVVWDVRREDVVFTDRFSVSQRGDVRLIPELTLKDGRPWRAASRQPAETSAS